MKKREPVIGQPLYPQPNMRVGGARVFCHCRQRRWWLSMVMLGVGLGSLVLGYVGFVRLDDPKSKHVMLPISIPIHQLATRFFHSRTTNGEVTHG